MAKVAGSLKQSTDIMQMVNNLSKIPEMQQTMMEMAREMTKAGVIEEMMEDTLGMMDDDDLEEEADEEVSKVLAEVTKGTRTRTIVATRQQLTRCARRCSWAAVCSAARARRLGRRARRDRGRHGGTSVPLECPAVRLMTRRFLGCVGPFVSLSIPFCVVFTLTH